MIESLDVVGLALWFVAFLLSATSHEAAHGLAARLGGDSTAYLSGQVTLNPLPHIRREPLGMIGVPLLSWILAGWMIGWASAPYDPHWARRHPRRSALMAAAGPAANFLLAALSLAVLGGALASGLGVAPDVATYDRLVAPVSHDGGIAVALRFFSVLAVLNALLGMFNLIPLPPLDGAAVVEGLGGRSGARLMDMMRNLPFAGIFGLLVAWQLFGLLAGPMFGWLLFVLHGARYG
jgi:Zn-dependent protease